MITNETLAAIPFFSGCTDRELELLTPICRVQEGQEGDYLIHEGIQVPCIYFLLSGKVGVYKKDKGGKHMWLASLGKGFIFGELSFLDQGPASASIRAGSPFQALAINQEALHRLLDSQPSLGYKMLKTMARHTSQRLRQADDMLAGFPGTLRDLTIM
jgi:CRP/FNR family cyclic AMP-dependent transcriptional regulator